jgi:hypothetical protein
MALRVKWQFMDRSVTSLRSIYYFVGDIPDHNKLYAPQYRELRDYYMTFSISAPVSARDSHIKTDSEAGGLIPRTIWKMSCQILFITYFTLTLFKH